MGSTSIFSIKAKPIIDIVVAVDDFNDILAYEKELKNDGFYYRPNAQASIRNQLLFACGSFYDGTGDLQTPIDSGREKYLKGKHDFIVITMWKINLSQHLKENITPQQK